jgi:hypothetical protein
MTSGKRPRQILLQLAALQSVQSMGSNEADQKMTHREAQIAAKNAAQNEAKNAAQSAAKNTIKNGGHCAAPNAEKLSGYDFVSSERLDLADRSFTAASNLHSIHPFTKKETAINGHLAASGFKLSLLFPRLAVHRICNR